MSDVEYGKMFFNVFNIGYKHVFKGFFYSQIDAFYNYGR